MPNIIEITDFHAPELDPYARLTQNQLRSRLEPEKGIFIAESPKVISRALDAGFVPVSLLMERRQITGPAAEILTRCGDAPVYTADRELLAATGGIVQGMSGSPIMQNGKLIGAVTHVLVNHPEQGYGILIGNMLAAA